MKKFKKLKLIKSDKVALIVIAAVFLGHWRLIGYNACLMSSLHCTTPNHLHCTVSKKSPKRYTEPNVTPLYVEDKWCVHFGR